MCCSWIKQWLPLTCCWQHVASRSEMGTPDDGTAPAPSAHLLHGTPWWSENHTGYTSRCQTLHSCQTVKDCNIRCGTMQLHQVSTTDCRNVVKVRTLSCFCKHDCTCYVARDAQLVHNLLAEQLPEVTQLSNIPCKQRARVCKKKPVESKRNKNRKQQRQQKAEENDSSCIICNGHECDDQEDEQWIQCNKCLRWAHELCVDVSNSDFFFCDFCR